MVTCRLEMFFFLFGLCKILQERTLNRFYYENNYSHVHVKCTLWTTHVCNETFSGLESFDSLLKIKKIYGKKSMSFFIDICFGSNYMHITHASEVILFYFLQKNYSDG